MEDGELMKMFNPTLKGRETILFFLIVLINGLIWIDSNIGLDTCTREMWNFFKIFFIIYIKKSDYMWKIKKGSPGECKIKVENENK